MDEGGANVYQACRNSAHKVIAGEVCELQGIRGNDGIEPKN